MLWLPEGDFECAAEVDVYADHTVVAQTSRAVFVRDGPGIDRTADSFLTQYCRLPTCSDQLKKDIDLARRSYCRTSLSADMSNVVRQFAVRVSKGKMFYGQRALHIWLNRVVRSCRWLGFEEAVEHISEWDSSPGWPYTEMGYQTRRMVLENLPLEKYVSDFLKSGKHAIWTGCLKEEVLKRAKYDKGLIRFFACCPIHVQVPLLQYSADLNERIMALSALNKFPTFVGVSTYGGGWNLLFSRFRSYKIVFSLDETLWDTTLHYDLFKAVYQIRNVLLDQPRSQEFVTWLVDEVVKTYIVSDTGEVFRKQQGNASGSSNTIIDNSLILLMIYLEAYFRMYPEDDIDDFQRYVALNVVGDDNICAVDESRSLFTLEVVMAVMLEWGIRPRIESITPGVVGAHYVSKDIREFEYGGTKYLVPVPSRVRLLAHYIYSTPGDNLLASAIKNNSLMLECVFDRELWDMFYLIQTWYIAVQSQMYRWETEDLPVQQFIASIFPREEVIRMHLGLELKSISRYKKGLDEVMSGKGKNKNKQGKKRQSTQRQNVTPAGRMSSNERTGKLVSAAIDLAKKVPVIGPVVDTVSSVASSVLSLLGLGSSIAEVHYLSDGVPRYRLRDPLAANLNTAVTEGSILVRYEISIGPSGSRSRLIGSLFQKVCYHNFNVSVMPASSAVSDGQLAYVMVTDPLDKSIDLMSPAERKHAILERPTGVKLAQVWQPTHLSYKMDGKEMYVNNADDIERFVCPGVLYVIAMTPVEIAKLPTIKVTTGMTFKKATTHTSKHDTLSAMVIVTGVDVVTKANGPNNVDSNVLQVVELDSWDPTRVTNVHYTPSVAGYGLNAQGWLLRQGEYMNLTCPVSATGAGLPNSVYALPSRLFDDSWSFSGSTAEFALRGNQLTLPAGAFRTVISIDHVAKEDTIIVPFVNEATSVTPAPDVSTTPWSLVIDTQHNVASAMPYLSQFKRHLEETKEGLRYVHFQPKTCKVEQKEDGEDTIVVESASSYTPLRTLNCPHASVRGAQNR